MPESYSGPFVSIACICQTPLNETNGQLSIIRVTDRVQIIGTLPKMQPQALQNLFLVLVLRSAELHGQSHNVRITAAFPSGNQVNVGESSALFEGDERGPGIIAPLAFVATEEGLYWFEVFLEDQLLTKIPLRVQYQKIQGIPFPQPGSSPQ
jgi:hypothetical protein